jgi:NitT/TauT family transport system substrate-binding protein
VHEAGRRQRSASSRPGFAVALLAAAAIAGVAACGGPSARTAAPGSPAASPGASPSVSASPSPEPSATLEPVRLVIQGVIDARSAGFITAIEQGYYESVGLQVGIVPVDPTAITAPVAGSGDTADFVVAWLPQVLRARDRGESDLVDIGQLVQRSGTLSMAWEDAEITSPADFRDQEVGLLGAGREFEITAATIEAGLRPSTDFTTVDTGASVDAFLAGDVDTAQALIYDQYAQVLEATNPQTGEPYRPIDLDIVNYQDVGTAILQDAIFARASWLTDEANEDLARRFLRASFQGWMRCRDDPTDCVASTLAFAAAVGEGPAASAAPSASAAPGLGAGHQAWMLNEFNPLVWPSPRGIGVMDTGAWQHTGDVLLGAGAISVTPPAEAYRTDLTEDALAGLADLDTTGSAFVKGTVEVTPGGQ